MVSEFQFTVPSATLFLNLWGARIPSGKRRTCLHMANRWHGWGPGQKSYFKRKTLALSRSPFLMFLPPSKHYHLQTKPSTHEFWGTFNEQTGAITFWDAGHFDFNSLTSRTQFSLCSTPSPTSRGFSQSQQRWVQSAPPLVLKWDLRTRTTFCGWTAWWSQSGDGTTVCCVRRFPASPVESSCGKRSIYSLFPCLPKLFTSGIITTFISAPRTSSGDFLTLSWPEKYDGHTDSST